MTAPVNPNPVASLPAPQEQEEWELIGETSGTRGAIYGGKRYIVTHWRNGDCDLQRIVNAHNASIQRLSAERDAARQEAATLLNERNAALLKLEPNPRQRLSGKREAVDGEDYGDFCQRLEATMRHWQDAIREFVIKKSGAPDHKIDGAGCESGDPIDFTLTEIGQAIDFAIEVIPPSATGANTVPGQMERMAAEMQAMNDRWARLHKALGTLPDDDWDNAPFDYIERLKCGPDIDALVNRFLSWPLPESVCSDPCSTERGYPHRSGTNLLTADEARKMVEYILAPSVPEAPKSDTGSEFSQTNPVWEWMRAEAEHQRATCECGECRKFRESQTTKLGETSSKLVAPFSMESVERNALSLQKMLNRLHSIIPKRLALLSDDFPDPYRDILHAEAVAIGELIIAEFPSHPQDALSLQREEDSEETGGKH